MLLNNNQENNLRLNTCGIVDLIIPEGFNVSFMIYRPVLKDKNKNNLKIILRIYENVNVKDDPS